MCGAIVCVGPATFWVTIGWPGATFPPLFTHTKVAFTEPAVRNAAVGPLDSPAAFPLQVRPVSTDFAHPGVPTKCGLCAHTDDVASVTLDLLLGESGYHRRNANPLLWQPGET